MALYRIGTAAMDAQGVITGTGTKWREPLSLIRTGATIVFLTTPLKLAVISDIVSDTEMKAIQTDGESVANGNYVILLNDSLTVDGMAQDVAETLRYYQSKETVIEEALDFFKDFDLQGLKDLVKQVSDSVADAKLSETNAAQSAQNTLEIKNQTEQLKADTNQIKQETQSIKDGAVDEINTAKQAAVVEIGTNKDSALQAITDSKTSVIAEMNIIKEETLDARDLAEAAQEGAERAETAANNAQTGAETARDKAEQWANSINPENLLHKDMNLSDLSDRAAAWLNVRPLGATPLAGDPVDDLDATTKGWVQTFIASVKSVLTSWSVINTDTVSPPANTIVNGGKVSSKYKVGTADNFGADFYAQAAIGNGITEARIEARGSKTAVMRFNSDGNLGLTGEVITSSVNGIGDAFTPVIRKLKDQQSTDGAKTNHLSLLENVDCKVTNLIFTRIETGVAEYSWHFTRSDGIQSWYSMRSDNTMHTPLGQVAIQGSDVRIKDRFEPHKPGAWDRVKQIGVMEFYYKGNHVLQRGYLAQQMAKIDDTYVFFGGTATDENGDEFEIMNVNDRAVISDLIVVVQELQKDNEEMKEEISEMKTAMAEMKAMLVKLTK